MDQADKVRENRLRRKADRLGYRLSRSRRRDPDALDYGMYELIDLRTGGAAHEMPLGRPNLTLDEVERWLTSGARREALAQ